MHWSMDMISVKSKVINAIYFYIEEPLYEFILPLIKIESNISFEILVVGTSAPKPNQI